MELSKLTICREDVIIVSDTELHSNEEPGSKQKRKQKNKTKCVRKVQLTTLKIDRILPYCNRKRCSRAQYHHKITSKNTKHRKNAVSAEVKARSITNKRNILPRNLQSPITIKSSSDAYENVSSCGFHTPSSDSDVLEELIKLTRQRMKKEKKDKYSNKLLKNPETTSITLNDYENISSDDTEHNSSIHSKETILLQHEVSIPSPPISPKHPDNGDLMESDNKNMTTLLPYSNHNEEDLVQEEMQSPSSQESNNLQYEISGKVLMEHYLNTSII